MARHYASTRFPTSPRELAQVMADPARFAEMFPNSEPGAWSDFADTYAASCPQITAQIAEQAQLEAARMLRETPGAGVLPGPVAAGMTAPQGRRGSRVYSKRAPGAAVDHLFAKTDPDLLTGSFLRAIWHRSPDPAAPGIQAKLDVRNAMSERVPGAGGFLVPEVLRADIIQMILERAIVRPRAHIIPMDSLRVPYPTIDETSHVSSVFGGIVANWTEESAQLSISQPAFGRLILEAKKLVVYTEVPNELLHDAAVVTDWIADQIPQAIAWYEDLAFITGSGVGQPQGVLNAPGAVVTGGGAAGARSGGAGAAVQFADIAAMYARLLPQSMRSPSTVWLCSPDVLPGLLQMVTAAPVTTSGTAAVAPPVWLGGPTGMSAASDRPSSILGFPLIVSEKMPALASQGCLALVDWSFYLLGDRMQMTATSSEHYKFASDLTAFRVIERCDGRAWLQSPLTLESGSTNTVSPYVLLHA